MGKRSANRHKNPHKKGNKKVHKEWSVTSIPDDNPLFKHYYQLQFPDLSPQEFETFWASLKQKLPVVFRVNPNFPNHQAFCKKLQDQSFLKNIVKFDQITEQKQGENKQEENIDPQEMPKLQLLPWYPGQLVYTLNTNKQQFKKSKVFGELHKYLQKSFDSGLISRQQLVSMLPPLYLQVQKDDIVLDMCAAPGSKTSQILQMLYGKNKELGKGCVIANDADYSRAQMLIHQINRAGTAGVAVINHPGQFLPQLYYEKINHIKNKFQFDKILCDVPCSGDGATRKIPIKWAKWHTSDGIVLHPLQLAILMKSINLLKKGGLLVYSTCSLNPMEDEAVLSALFHKVQKGLEILDIHGMFDVKGRRGLHDWKVCGIVNREQKDETGKNKRQIKIYQNFEEAKTNPKIKPSLFAPSVEISQKIGLHNSMRILPHDQNSGGFFIALLKKHHDFQWKYQTKIKKEDQKQDSKEQSDQDQKFVKEHLPKVEKDVVLDNEDPKDQGNPEGQKDEEDNEAQQMEEEKNKAMDKTQNKEKDVTNSKENAEGEQKKKKGSKYETFLNLQEAEYELIKKFYGFPNDDLRKLLYVREAGNNRRKVILVSEGIRNFLEADVADRIKLVNMGCRVFQKGKESFAGHECLYRLCQEGIHFLLPYAEKRRVRVPLQFFKKVLSIHSLTHEQIEDIEVREKIRAMSQGSFFIYVDEELNGERVVDALVGQNFKNSFHLMVSKEDVASLNIRYL